MPARAPIPFPSNIQQPSAVSELEQSLTHTRDLNKSSSGWERLSDGTWFRREYYKLNEQIAPPPKIECGIHVLNNIFTGSIDVLNNIDWIRSKDIHRVLVLGNTDAPASDIYRLRIVRIAEGHQLDSYLDSIVSLITEAVAENANVLLIDQDNRTYNPTCLVAYLLCSGWSFDWAVERIEGIFHVALNPYKLQTLRNWDKIMESRRATLVAEVQRTQSYNMPQILQSPLPITSSGESVIVTSVPPYVAAPVVQSLQVLPPSIATVPSTVSDVVSALPARVPQAYEILTSTSLLDVTPTTTDQWGPRTRNSATAIQNVLRRYDEIPDTTAHRDSMTA